MRDTRLLHALVGFHYYRTHFQKKAFEPYDYRYGLKYCFPHCKSYSGDCNNRFWKWFVQFKKRLKHPQRSLAFSKVAGKSNTPPWGFFTFFKLYKWNEIVQALHIILLRSLFLEILTLIFLWPFLSFYLSDLWQPPMSLNSTCIHIPVKHLWCKIFATIVTGWKTLNYFCKEGPCLVGS